MRTSLRVWIAGLLAVGICWLVFLKVSYLILPGMALLLAFLTVMRMGYKCLQGTNHSFFWFVGVCVVAFLTPVLLWSPTGGDIHIGWRIALSVLLLLFAFWPRGEIEEEDEMFDDEVYDEHETDNEYAYEQTFVSTTPSTASIVDDLKKIEGVGPAIEQLLYNAGITSYTQLANASYESLQAILAAAGNQFQLHDPFTRPDQAALARDGAWEQLKTFQDLLDGGRE